ncbi:MAG TPA: hypothetical protein VHV79_09225 [Mycobacteriales bacterium]|jgi:hypothetical protein|nr:hypothetical protein [Mycobacteriales bacterium]
MSPEDRLRRALNDGDWSLPIWAAPAAQLRHAARRRMAVTSAAAVAVVAAVTVGVVVPLTLAGGAATPPIAKHPHHHSRFELPKLGDPRFPTSIYPAPGRKPAQGSLSCPSLAGTDPNPPSIEKKDYRQLASDFGGQSFVHDLERTDRTLWPRLRHEYLNLSQVTGTVPIGTWDTVRVTPAKLDGNAASATVDCGAALVLRSVALTYIQSGTGGQTAYVLQRDHHLLLWGPLPYVSGTSGADPYEGESKTYIRNHPASCGDVFQHDRLHLTGASRYLELTAHLPKDYFRCVLSGWLPLTLTSTNGPALHPARVGPRRRIILTPGQRASVILRLPSCPGPRTSYDQVDHHESHVLTQLNVSLSIGPCGLTESSFQRD